VDRVQQPGAHPVIDRGRANAALNQLTPRHHPMLSSGQIRDQPVGVLRFRRMSPSLPHTPHGAP
jgi:hypothetical protein